MDAQVAIIGAGPIGLELAIALKKADISYLQFDAKQVGYTISWFAPQTRFFSSNERIAIAGVPLQTVDQLKATREEYLTYLRGIAQQFDLPVHTYEPVTNIRRVESASSARTDAPRAGATNGAPRADTTSGAPRANSIAPRGSGGVLPTTSSYTPSFELTTHPAGGPKTYHVQNVVLATGGTAAPNPLNIPGEDLPHVSHYFTDPHLYFRQKVLIIGGRNSAVEAALRCYHAGADVSLSYRHPHLPEKHIKYWLLPEMNTLMETGRVTPYMDTRPVKITPTHVTLARPDGQQLDVPADFVLALTGYVADMTLFQKAGVELQGARQQPKFSDTTMETNVPGLYVAGTAANGTQESRYTLFIENCHVHVQRIVAALTGHAASIPTPTFARPES